MSGGSMDYLYAKVECAKFERTTPERRAFAVLLRKVAHALCAIEWVDSGDAGEGSENEAILACLGRGAMLDTLTQEAHKALARLKAELERLEMKVV